VAPEVLSGSYSEKVDIWGAGVLLHVLLLGSLPFRGGCLDAVFEAIKTVELDFNSRPWESISGLGRDLIGRMLNRDMSSRITADEVLSKLKFLSFSSYYILCLRTPAFINAYFRSPMGLVLHGMSPEGCNC
jgi:serine/threonine protein kinase